MEAFVDLGIEEPLQTFAEKKPPILLALGTKRPKKGMLKKKNKGTPNPNPQNWIGTRGTQVVRVSRYDAVIYNVNTSASSGDIANGYIFMLNHVAQYTDLTSTFRYYRITSVDAEWMPAYNFATHSNGTVNNPGLCVHYIVREPTDGSVSGFSLQIAAADQSCIVKWSGTPFKLRLIPRVDVSVYQSATSTAYAPTQGEWLQITDTAVPHYGMKVLTKLQSLQPVVLPSDIGSFIFRYHMEFAVSI